MKFLSSVNFVLKQFDQTELFFLFYYRFLSVKDLLVPSDDGEKSKVSKSELCEPELI